VEDFGRRMLCLAGIEVSSAKSEVCDCRKKFVSINQFKKLQKIKQSDTSQSAKITRRLKNLMLPSSYSAIIGDIKNIKY